MTAKAAPLIAGGRQVLYKNWMKRGKHKVKYKLKNIVE